MKEKIFLINTPLFHDKKTTIEEDFLPPIGLGYIATHLINNGKDVKLIDAISENFSLNDLIAISEAETPNFIGLNIFSSNYNLVEKFVKSINLNVHFIIGGIVTKSIYNEIFSWETTNIIDVVYGDGELISLDIINDTLCQLPTDKTNRRRYFLVDKESPYFINEISDIPLDRKLFSHEPIINYYGENEIAIITSRGCIYNCAFCSAARYLNKEIIVRERTPKSIIDELSLIQNIYKNIKFIRVLDDLFLKDIKSINDAINIFSKFDLFWRSMAHIMTFNKVEKDILDQLKKSGCKELFIGIESGSESTLKKIKKYRDFDIVNNVFRKIFSSTINVKGYLILGFPQETEKDFIKTYDLARFLKDMANKYCSNFRVSVFQFRPYHGTQIYNDIKKNSSTQIDNIKANTELSKLIGRDSFNFSSGNYSAASSEILYKYIKLISEINER